MAGLLEYLLASHLGGPPTGMPGNIPWPEAPAADESGLTEEAAAAAAARLRRSRKGMPALPVVDPAGAAAAPAAGPISNASMLPGVGMLPITGGAPSATFADLDSGAIPSDPAAAAQEARDVAAGRVARSVKRPAPALPAYGDAIPHINDVAGLLSGSGGGPPSTNDPLSGEPKFIGGAQSVDESGFTNAYGDQAGPARPAPLSLSPQGAPDELPENARPSQAAQPPVPAGPSIFDKIFDPNKAATYLALGAGFAGAPSIGTGMRRAFSNAVPALAADRAQIQKQTTIADTYRALIKAGATPAEALAASQNPEVLKTISGKYFDDQLVPAKLGTDWLGNEIQGSFHKRSGKYYDAAGNLIGGSGGADAGQPGTGAAPGASGGMSSPLAKGVKSYDAELPADEYKAQFSPEVQAAMEAYANGDTMPTANPRLKGFAPKVKEWAQLWGNKSGVPVSDSEFARKRTMQTQIASSSPNSMGGILSNGKSAFGHLANLAENFVDLGNRSGPDVPGGSWAGRTANVIGNQVVPTPETSGKLEAVRDNAGKYGAEATKFYAGTGGGVEERLSALHGIAQPGTLATEQAAYLKTEKGLMLERLAQKEAQIRDTMGEKWLSQHPVKTPDLQKHIDRIDASIRRLQAGEVGGSSAAPAAPKVGKTSGGISWSIDK